jgi:hypothetical protein
MGEPRQGAARDLIVVPLSINSWREASRSSGISAMRVLLGSFSKERFERIPCAFTSWSRIAEVAVIIIDPRFPVCFEGYALEVRIRLFRLVVGTNKGKSFALKRLVWHLTEMGHL